MRKNLSGFGQPAFEETASQPGVDYRWGWGKTGPLIRIRGNYKKAPSKAKGMLRSVERFKGGA